MGCNRSRSRRCRGFLSVAAFGFVLGCAASADAKGYVVIRELPHDTSAYTQGLLYADGWLYESTGRFGRSELRKVHLESGRPAQVHRLPADRFGEGLALLDGRLYQLTWKSGVGYVYDASTLTPLDSFTYTGEGWGLASDGAVLIMSDGTSTLRFLDPDGMRVVRELTVRDKGSELQQLNELEYVGGELLANVYQGDWIVRIDPATGDVIEWIDFAGLLPDGRRTPSTDVLNGIAFIPESGHLLVTGKLWPTVFEVRLVAPADSARAHREP